jgi:outer membrane protein assembly factor BamB
VWNFATGGDVVSSPAVAEGILYFGSYDGKVYAIDASNGDLIWTYQTYDIVVSSPAIAEGVLYIGSYDHIVYAFGSQGDSQEKLPHDDWMILLLASVVIFTAALVALVLWKRRKERHC